MISENNKFRQNNKQNSQKDANFKIKVFRKWLIVVVVDYVVFAVMYVILVVPLN